MTTKFSHSYIFPTKVEIFFTRMLFVTVNVFNLINTFIMPIVKVIEVIASSEKSFDDAIKMQ